MNPPLLRTLGLGMLLALGVSCAPSEPPGSEPETEAQIFRVRGVVQDLATDDPKKIIIDHEEIPDYMRAMVMPFRVKDPAVLEGLQPGDVIEFDYHVEDLQSWIEDVDLTGETRTLHGETEPTASTESELSEGDLLPDYEFVDENGKDVKISDFRGQPVGLTFVFTRCPVPEYCPAMMHNFRKVLTRLEGDTNAPEDFQLLTISFDVDNDTPEVMKAWGAAFGHEEGQPWSLLTSDSCCTINELAANVGLKFGEVESGSYQHNLRTVVLDSSGRIQTVFTDESWTPDAFVAALKSADADT